MGLTAADASQKIAERLTWCAASRDRAGIASDLAGKKAISEVHGLGEAGLYDEFFCFLEESGIMKLFLKLDPDMRERGSNVKFPAVIPIYLMRIVAGLRFFRHIDIVRSRSPKTTVIDHRGVAGVESPHFGWIPRTARQRQMATAARFSRPIEVFIPCGTNVRMPAGVPEVISARDILLEYGAPRE